MDPRAWIRTAQACSRATLSKWYLNFTSASGGAKPSFFATEDADGNHDALNYRLLDFITARPQRGRLGTVVMDFPEYPLKGPRTAFEPGG